MIGVKHELDIDQLKDVVSKKDWKGGQKKNLFISV